MEHVVCLDCKTLHERSLIDALLTAANPTYFDSVEVEGSMLNPDGDVELKPVDVLRDDAADPVSYTHLTLPTTF